MNLPAISVVIPTFNGRKRIARCLDSIAGQSVGASQIEVIVVDDGSTDGTSEELSARQDPFELVVVQMSNSGPPHARNTGAQKATSNILAFLDDDVVCRSDCFEKALTYFSAGTVSVVEAHLLLEGSDRPLLRRSDDQGFITAVIFFRKEVFAAVGGMDESFFDKETRVFFRDDSDLGFRVLEAGYKAVQPHDVVAWHPELFPNLRACLAHARRYMFDPLLYRNHPALFRKHVERKRVGPFTFGRPMHYACLVSAFACAGTIVAVALSLPLVVGAFIVPWGGAATVLRYKFHGARAIPMWNLLDTFVFMLFPFWYFYWLVRGCVKFGGWGSLV